MTKANNKIKKSNVQPLHFNSYLRVSKESDLTGRFTIDEKQLQASIDAAASRAPEARVVGQVGYGWKWEPITDVKGRRRNVITQK